MKWLLAAFVAGLVCACGFQPVGAWPLAMAAFAFLLWLVDQAPRLRGALARGWWFGMGFFTLGLNWIATSFTYQANMPAWLGWIAVVLLALYLAVYPGLAAGLAWRCGRGRPPALVLAAAAAWIVSEWLRATMFTGFAWNPLGVMLVGTPLAWPAAWVGTYGLSGIAVLLAGLVYLAAVRQWRSGAVVAASLCVLALAARIAASPFLPAGGLAVRIVQPNIGQDVKWKPGQEDINLKRLESLSHVGPKAPRLVLWPEAAITMPLQDGRQHGDYRQAAAELRRKVARTIGPADMLLTGGLTIEAQDGVTATGATNSVFAIDSAGRVRTRYDKAHLVPYGEYLPMRPLLSAFGLSRLAPGDIDFVPGPGAETLDIIGVGRIGLQVCYEIIFSGQVVERGDRPDFLFNPSNDAWFGAWGPPQHLAQARLRALEEGLPVLRSTPTGISAVIDAEGRLLRSLPWRTAGVIDAPLPPAKPPTLFARGGNILPLLLALLLAAAAIMVRRRPR